MPVPPVRRRLLQGLGLAAALGVVPTLALAPRPARAQQGVQPGAPAVPGGTVAPAGAGAGGIELAQLATAKREGELQIEFAARITLPRAVEDALQRGVPVYFYAEATLRRNRWYWRDERVARVSRLWRVAYQPLTNSWRVGLGALNQTLPSLADALAAISRSAGWKLAELRELDPDSRYYVEFAYRLDTTQLPGPMQIGLGGQAEWAIGAERTQRVE